MVNREALLQVLKMYDNGGVLMNVTIGMHVNSKVEVRLE